MLSLVGDYKSSNDESSDDSSETKSKPVNLLPLPTFKELSKPGEKITSSGDVIKRKLLKNSVYSNPFLKAEEDSLTALSKHGPLVDSKPPEKKFNARKSFKRKTKNKICNHFFKHNTCKYGDDCKFLHSIRNNETPNDNADNKIVIRAQEEQSYNITPSVTKLASVNKRSVKKSQMKNFSFLEHSEKNFITETDDALWEGGKMDRKRRVGISDTIVPPKRALEAYQTFSKP